MRCTTVTDTVPNTWQRIIACIVCARIPEWVQVAWALGTRWLTRAAWYCLEMAPNNDFTRRARELRPQHPSLSTIVEHVCVYLWSPSASSQQQVAQRRVLLPRPRYRLAVDHP
eukprot:m.69510 g.69510  ORF g.69510 m.69510 type:complete len:113 (+) comp16026_c0_seq21:1000-1338(+)